MKWLSTILALIIMTLNVVPALEMIDLNPCSKSCDIADAQELPDENNYPCNDICNPFMSCATCLGFTVSESSDLVEQQGQFAEHTAFHHESASLVHTYSIWHPPKFS